MFTVISIVVFEPKREFASKAGWLWEEERQISSSLGGASGFKVTIKFLLLLIDCKGSSNNPPYTVVSLPKKFQLDMFFFSLASNFIRM